MARYLGGEGGRACHNKLEKIHPKDKLHPGCSTQSMGDPEIQDVYLQIAELNLRQSQLVAMGRSFCWTLALQPSTASSSDAQLSAMFGTGASWRWLSKWLSQPFSTPHWSWSVCFLGRKRTRLTHINDVEAGAICQIDVWQVKVRGRIKYGNEIAWQYSWRSSGELSGPLHRRLPRLEWFKFLRMDEIASEARNDFPFVEAFLKNGLNAVFRLGESPWTWTLETRNL